MQKQNEVARSQEPKALVKQSGLSMELVLRAQPDKAQAITHIALLIERIAMLWQMPNWSMQNSILLAEWTFENYECEPLEVISKCLKNPPAMVAADNKTWRLTPEVITNWMTGFLEKAAIEREQENQKMKEAFKHELPEIDYESYKKRINEGTALQDNKPKRWTQDEGYQKFKAERFRKAVSAMPPTGDVQNTQEPENNT